MRPILPDPRIRPRPQAPNRLCPCLSNLIGHRSWSLPPADIFQRSPLGDVLNSLKSLSLSGDSWPNYVRLEREADDERIRYPPNTHLIATVDDLTDTLDFDSEDVDRIYDNAGEEQEPPPTGRWTDTSSYGHTKTR